MTWFSVFRSILFITITKFMCLPITIIFCNTHILITIFVILLFCFNLHSQFLGVFEGIRTSSVLVFATNSIGGVFYQQHTCSRIGVRISPEYPLFHAYSKSFAEWGKIRKIVWSVRVLNSGLPHSNPSFFHTAILTVPNFCIIDKVIYTF